MVAAARRKRVTSSAGGVWRVPSSAAPPIALKPTLAIEMALGVTRRFTSHAAICAAQFVLRAAIGRRAAGSTVGVAFVVAAAFASLSFISPRTLTRGPIALHAAADTMRRVPTVKVDVLNAPYQISIEPG